MPDHAVHNACMQSDALSCAVGTLIGAAIVGGIGHYQKEKRTKLLQLSEARHTAKVALDKIDKELVTHTYAPYAFKKATYHVRKVVNVKSLIVDLQTNQYSGLSFTRRDESPVTVLEGFSDLDKNRNTHTADALTETEYVRRRTASLEIPFSKVVSTFEHKVLAHGNFQNFEGLANIAREMVVKTAPTQ